MLKLEAFVSEVDGNFMLFFTKLKFSIKPLKEFIIKI